MIESNRRNTEELRGKVLSDDQNIDYFISCFEDDEESIIVRHLTERESLREIYSRLPAKFPVLFEKLLLNYRWSSIWLYGAFRLLDSTDDKPDLSGFLGEIFKDENLVTPCLQNGYIQFAFAYDRYDPVCFNTNKRTSANDFEIVRLDHELLLQRSKIKAIKTLAPSFELLMAGDYHQPG